MALVRGFCLLGSAGFPPVEWVAARFLVTREADRELPSLKGVADRPLIGAIRTAAEAAFPEDQRAPRREALYLCHRFSGKKLREIGEQFGVGESAVSEASRSVKKALARSSHVGAEVGRLRKTLAL